MFSIHNTQHTSFFAYIALTTPISTFTLSETSATANKWTKYAYIYLAAFSTNVTLKFLLQTNKKITWAVDDVSILTSSSVELLTNGGFESTPLTSGWTPGSLDLCSTTAGGTTNGCHTSTQCYYDACDGANITISQSVAVTAGQSYNVSFWYYYDYQSGGGWSPVQMTVTLF